MGFIIVRFGGDVKGDRILADVIMERCVGGEAADGRQPVADAQWSEAQRSSGTFAAANGGFAALLMGSLGVGADGCVLGFKAGFFVRQSGTVEIFRVCLG